MKLLDQLSGRKEEETAEHAVNPVYDTAKNCLSNLAKAKCEEALRLNRELNFTEDPEVRNPIDRGVALFQEIRYRFVNEEVIQTGIQNILDIGCGYSPRGILFSEKGYHYIGADIPAAVQEVEPAVKRCVSKENSERLKYIGLDATDPQALLQAAGHLDGPVCIVTEGVMMYFPTYELDEYLKGLRGVLKAHGGCVITPDFCMNRLLKLSIGAAVNKVAGELLQFGAGKVVGEYIISAKNEMDPSVWYAEEDDEKPYAYFTAKGFRIERVPVYRPGMKLNGLENIEPVRARKLTDAYQETYGWKITV